MSTKSIFIALLSLILISPIFFSSCKKDQVLASNSSVPVYDTLFPLDYFPAFPGSYWKYINSNNDTTISQTSAEYKLDHYVCCGNFVSDTFYVPVHNGTPIWGYSAHSGLIGNALSTPMRRILSDSLPVGSTWYVLNYGSDIIKKRVSAKDTSVTINGTVYYPTIVIEEYYPPGGAPPMPFLYRRYYTKDIGLIREDHYHYLDSSITSIEIFDYFINN